MDDFDESIETIPLSQRIKGKNPRTPLARSPLDAVKRPRIPSHTSFHSPLSSHTELRIGPSKKSTPPAKKIENKVSPKNGTICIELSDDEEPSFSGALPPLAATDNFSDDSLDSLKDLMPFKVRDIPHSSTPLVVSKPTSSTRIDEENIVKLKGKSFTHSQADKEAKKAEKQREQEAKKAEKQREQEAKKELKKAEQESRKAKSIAHAHEYCVAMIDKNIVERFAKKDEIPNLFNSKSMKFQIVDRNRGVKNSVVWKRKQLEVNPDWNDSDDSLDEVLSQGPTQKSFVLQPNEVQEDQIVCVFPMERYIRAVHALLTNSEEDETLVDLINSVARDESDIKITIMPYNVASYFKNKKSKDNRQFRNEVLSQFDEAPTASHKRKSAGMPHVTMEDVFEAEEMAILQLKQSEKELSVAYLHVDSGAELANALFHITKAVAEAPYKRAATGQDRFSFFIAGEKGTTVAPDTRDEVVDLWKQQLQQFPKLASDSANALVKSYPTPHSLINACKKVRSEADQRKLLADVKVGRDPSASRALGQEMSRKICLFMTSREEKRYLNPK